MAREGDEECYSLVEPHSELHAVTERLESEIGHQLSVEFELKASPRIIGDKARIREALLCLVRNAFEATNYQGAVFIATEDTPSGRMKIVVHDTGPGLPRDMIDHAFEPFVSTKQPGRGMGLSVVKHVVDEHRGSVAVHNKGGAEFFVTLQRDPGV